MKKFKNLISFMLLLFVSFNVKAQITTDEDPISFGNASMKRNLASQKVISISKAKYMDKAVIEKEDKERDADPDSPLRFAFPVQLDYNLENSGSWTTLSNGDKVWTLNLHFEDALSLHAMYDKFWIPKGAKFFVYSNETKQKIGAITHEYLEGNSSDPQ